MQYNFYFSCMFIMSLGVVFGIMPTVLFIDGPPRAGKTTVCDIMRQNTECGVISSLYPDWLLCSVGDMFPRLYLTMQKAISAENMVHALRRNIIMFKKQSTRHEKNDAVRDIDVIRKSFFKEHMITFRNYSHAFFKESIQVKKHMICDGSHYRSFGELYEGHATRDVLLYCPLHEIIKRTIHCNNNAFKVKQAGQHRFFNETLCSFLKLFGFSSESHGSIDIVHRNEMEDILKMIRSYIVCAPQKAQNPFIIQEFTFSELQQYESLLRKFFGNHSFLYIVPKKKYDLVIHTNKIPPAACVDMIAQLIDGV